MYVHVDDATAFVEDAGWLKPQAFSDATMKTVLGDPAGRFWSYDPSEKLWKDERCRYPWEMPRPSAVLPEDGREFARVVEWVSGMGTPDLPEDRALVHRQPPFLYEGFVFSWLFLPELGRWELLPRGKHDAASAMMSRN